MPDLRRLVVPLFAGYVALFAVLLHTSGPHVALWLYGSSSVVFGLLVALLSRVEWTPSRLALVILAGAAVLQVVALTRGPTTSDDVYRYLWDGRVQFSGTDPYAYPPVSSHLTHLRDGSLFLPPRAHCAWRIPDGCSLINRPSVRTIYPPVAQLIFDGGHLLGFGAGGTGGVHVFQVLAALGVLAGTVLLLRASLRAGRPLWPVAIWAWSPLVVIEYGNNAHVDWAAVLLSLGCLELARRGRAGWTGLLLAAATLTKIYPALIGPAVLKRRPWLVLVVAAAAAVVAYVPHVLAAGTDVIGYLPGYLHEEGYNSGTRLLLLGAVLPHPVDTVVGVLIIAAAALWCWSRSDADAPEQSAVVLVGVAFLVTTPGYGWYAGLLLALAVLARRLEWVPLAFAPTFVYLVRAEVSKATWYGTTIYAVAGGVLLVAVLARRRAGRASLHEVGVG
ncbi:glycosyltransferase 87 family protein [uncultured Jatrophihabitans sp.]|uniref:glycosyltransferase 87 family protein n=1 Tax=uncultured Jatrophihabitans sp. TaxID=1610747 RepID=UPI0035CA6F7D